MKKNIQLIFILILFFTISGIAKTQNFDIVSQCATFFKDGKKVVDVINFMSTRHPKIGFINNDKFNLHKVWMINFIKDEWNYPEERKVLKENYDTILLKNGRIIYDKVITYSTKFKVFRFNVSKGIHSKKIKRIYFCCTKFPDAYKNKLDNIVINPYTTFMANGTVVTKNIKYFNNEKTGFVDGMQVNTKDLIMINFVDKKKYFTGEKIYFNSHRDTLILKDGKIVSQLITGFDINAMQITFQDNTKIKLDIVSRVYFKKKKVYPIRKYKRVKDLNIKERK